MASSAELTDRQLQVLHALCRPVGEDGPFLTPATNKEIAAELGISVDAVKHHLRALFALFDIDHVPQNRKRAQLVAKALVAGAVPVPPRRPPNPVP